MFVLLIETASYKFPNKNCFKKEQNSRIGSFVGEIDRILMFLSVNPSKFLGEESRLMKLYKNNNLNFMKRISRWKSFYKQDIIRKLPTPL